MTPPGEGMRDEAEELAGPLQTLARIASGLENVEAWLMENIQETGGGGPPNPAPRRGLSPAVLAALVIVRDLACQARAALEEK